jgi:hypothetical protein
VSHPPHRADCDYHRDCPAEAETFDQVAELRAEIERLRSVAYFLRIYVHAHQNDNRVPPHIEAAAVEMLGGGDGAAGVEVEK